MAGREPQSYGSQADWTRGTTDQNVTDPKSEPRPEHRDFYDDRRESDENEAYQGGLTSPVQLAENDAPGGRTDDESLPVGKVSGKETGAKRDSFFRRRDYE